MQEELQSKLVEILSSIQAATGKATDFAMEQLPDIAQSYVMYGRVSSLFWVVAASACVYAAVKGRAKAAKAFDDLEAWPMLVWVGAAIAAVVALVNAQEAFLVWFAPKVWLLKELAQLVK